MDFTETNWDVHALDGLGPGLVVTLHLFLILWLRFLISSMLLWG